ncbi:MAG: MBL fold metallo-hydrolase [Dehalococcoidia bacterium]|nr:MBL fold metallo-hydrolase [Dehalococcoidia bacterium]
MELEILGSWAGSPGPKSACSGYLISEGDTQLLFDCGPGVVPQLQVNHDPSKIDAIFISHMHADHSMDLLTYAYRLIRFSWRGLAPDQIRPIPLYLPPGGLQVLAHLVAAFGRPDSGRLADPFQAAFIPAELIDGKTIAVGSLIVTPYEVMHAVPAFAYRVQGAASSFAYSGDTKLCPGLKRASQGVDMLLSEATSLENDPRMITVAGHLTAGQAGEVAAEAGTGCLVLTHFPRQDQQWLLDVVHQAHVAFRGKVISALTGLKSLVPEVPSATGLHRGNHQYRGVV